MFMISNAPRVHTSKTVRWKLLKRLCSRGGLAVFAGSRSGTTAIEFAFVAAPFFAVVFMVFQVALYHFSTQSLDFATRLAARIVMTGELPASVHDADGFKRAVICPQLMSNLSCDDIVVNAYRLSPESNPDLDTGIYRFVDEKAKSLAAVNRGQSAFCVGGPGDYVFLDVAYEMPSFIGNLLSVTPSDPPIYLMRSTTLVRSEQYAGSPSAC